MSLADLAGRPGLREHLPEIEAYLGEAADPDAVIAGLEALLDAGADPLPALAGWLRLLDTAPAVAEVARVRPALAREIPHEQGAYDRANFEAALDESLRSLPTLDERLDRLRAVRVDETARIAWQDVVGGADLTVVTRRISDLAEILMERAVAEVHRGLARRFGRPWHGSEPVGVAVIAMGKLGGAELNYFSDIDLIFLYGKDGETDGGDAGRTITNREYFHRLTERVSREVNAVTPHGRLYRVDLRLRPEGAVGSLARTLASSLAYYRRMGETWERQALLKARVIAGDRALGEEFVNSVRTWAYGRGLDFAEIASIKRLKARVESITATRGEERSEVKLGYGGIRDVEYVIQFLQLLHGARLPSVRHHNSLTALRLLEARGAILPRERDVLDDAYRFLRLVEHRLQLVQGAQVHNIPDSEPELGALARRCGFPDADAFGAERRRHAEAVREIFNRLFRHLFEQRDEEQVRETDLILRQTGEPEELSRILEAHGIRDLERGVWAVEELCRETSPWLAGSPRTRKFFSDLFPRLLDAVQRTPDPDAALERLERITSRVGARATLYDAMIADDGLLSLLVDLAGHSLFLSNILAHAPGALDQLVDAVAREPSRGLASFEDIPTATVPTAPDPARILSDYKNLELLRIGLRDVRGRQGVRDTGEDLTRLAEVIVRLAYERARREAGCNDAGLVVLALGKFGAGEMLYGSDLDLVFFGRDGDDHTPANAVARRLSTLLGTPGAHGKLYEVDARLRPGGRGGPLITTARGFQDYFARGLGQTWERLSFTRARPVAGPPALCEEVAAAVAETIYAPGFGREDALAIQDMRARLAAAGGPESIKRSGAGGVVDVEFVAQMLALRHGRDDERFRRGNVTRLLTALAEADVLPGRHAADLQAAYGFLLALESRIRIVADTREDRLPNSDRDRRTLARRLGYRTTAAMRAEESLAEEYAYHRDVAAKAFHATVRQFAAD